MAERTQRRAFSVLALALATSGCAAMANNQQGSLQPQEVHGPCQVKRFFLQSLSAVPAEMTISNSGQACALTLLNPDLQAFPSAVLLSGSPVHGRVETGLANGGRSPFVAYTPQPGYTGPDRFTVTIEPNDFAVAFTVAVNPPQ